MRLTDLPRSAREIAEAIGIESTLRLIGQLPTCHAGVDGKKSNRVILYVPKKLKPDHQLVRILGWITAHKLARAFGGEILCPPNCRSIYTKFRDQSIVDMLNAGARAEMVSELMGVSVRHVRNVFRQHQITFQKEKS